MNESVTNQIMPNHSLESLATISNWNILDIQWTAQTVWKNFDIRTTDGSGK